MRSTTEDLVNEGLIEVFVLQQKVALVSEIPIEDFVRRLIDKAQLWRRDRDGEPTSRYPVVSKICDTMETLEQPGPHRDRLSVRPQVKMLVADEVIEGEHPPFSKSLHPASNGETEHQRKPSAHDGLLLDPSVPAIIDAARGPPKPCQHSDVYFPQRTFGVKENLSNGASRSGNNVPQHEQTDTLLSVPILEEPVQPVSGKVTPQTPQVELLQPDIPFAEGAPQSHQADVSLPLQPHANSSLAVHTAIGKNVLQTAQAETHPSPASPPAALDIASEQTTHAALPPPAFSITTFVRRRLEGFGGTRSAHFSTARSVIQMPFHTEGVRLIGKNLYNAENEAVTTSIQERWDNTIHPRIRQHVEAVTRGIGLQPQEMAVNLTLSMVGPKVGNMLHLEPTIIISCAHKKAKKSIDQLVKSGQLDYLRDFACAHLVCTKHRDRLHRDRDRFFADIESIEAPGSFAMSSPYDLSQKRQKSLRFAVQQVTACGLKVDFTYSVQDERHNVVLEGEKLVKLERKHRMAARIGGTIYIGNKPFAMTTAHTFLFGEIDGEESDSSDDGNSISSGDSISEMQPPQDETNELATHDPVVIHSEPTAWLQEDHLHGSFAFCDRGRRFESQDLVSLNAPNSDWCTLSLESLRGLTNCYVTKNDQGEIIEVAIDEIGSGETPPSGDVHIIDDPQKPLVAYMTQIMASIYFGGKSLAVRRLISKQRLPTRLSGCWVVRGKQLLGHIVAGNEFEKTMYMVGIQDTKRAIEEVMDETVSLQTLSSEEALARGAVSIQRVGAQFDLQASSPQLPREDILDGTSEQQKDNTIAKPGIAAQSSRPTPSKHSKRKKSSKDEQVPTQWSEWTWGPENSCYSRYRLDKYGEYEFEYGPPGTNESTDSLSYEDSRRSETPRYTNQLQDTTSEELGTFGTSPVTPGYSASKIESTTAAFGALDLSKGKGAENEYAAFPLAASYSFEPLVAQPLPVESAVDNSNWYTPYGGGYPQNSGSSSYQQQVYPAQIWQDNVPYNPNLQQTSNYIGEGSRGLEGPLDRHFSVHHGSEFKVGSVFKILWAEPTGDNGTQLSESVHSRSHRFQEEFVHKIRRFVVVKTFMAHCLCLPIQTYGQQGARKKGAQAQHHAVIYSEKEVEYKGENLTKKAIRVEMTTPREKLDPHCRINYAKVYTIEYNVKVYFIGRVHHKHRHQILADYQNTQSLSIHDPGYEYDDSLTVYG